MTNTVEVLKKARELISDEKRWTQGMIARDAAGKFCGPLSKKAKCYCIMGALMKAADGEDEWRDAGQEFCKASGQNYLARFNDSHSHADVIANLDAAIARLA